MLNFVTHVGSVVSNTVVVVVSQVIEVVGSINKLYLVVLTVWWDTAELQVQVVKLFLELLNLIVLLKHDVKVASVLRLSWAVAVWVALGGKIPVVLSNSLADNNGVLELVANGGEGEFPLGLEVNLELSPDLGWAFSVVTKVCWVWEVTLEGNELSLHLSDNLVNDCLDFWVTLSHS